MAETKEVLLKNQENSWKETLLARLLDAVKQCQGHFGSKKELAVDGDSRVCCLLAQLEAVLHHGLRRDDSALATIKQVTGMLTNLRLDSSSEDDLTLWSCVRCVLSEEEESRFLKLRNVWTDAGRGRSWIRAALNERSLPRYIDLLLAGDLLPEFYENWAFLRDPDLSATLPQIAQGLSTILFAINIDNGDLNSPRAIPQETKEMLAETRRAPQPIISLNNSHHKDSKRKKKPLVNVVSFDSTTRKFSQDEGRMKVVPRRTESPSSSPVVPHTDQDSVNSVISNWNSRKTTLRSVSVGSDDSAFLPRQSSIPEETSSEFEVMMSPISKEVQVKDLYSGQRNGMASGAVGNCIQETDYSKEMGEEAPQMHSTTLSTNSGELLVLQTDDKEEVESVSSKISTDDSVFLKEDSSGDGLKDRLESQMEVIECLKAEVSLLKQRKQDMSHSYQIKIESVTNENAVLRNQLKGYMEAVQSLKEEALPPGDSLGASYEQKLIQVAQMHAELMEFNDRLVRDLNRKKKQMKRLREELAELRGPLPEDFSDEEQSVSSDTDSSLNRPLVNIWIPSTFLTGKGTDVHSVYQVYIRIRSVEWNVYRRYQDFYLLHQKLKKQDQHFAGFKFPPKKTVGKKEKKFVEERRKALEQYLRMAVNRVVQTFPEFTAIPVNKQSLAEILPLLNDGTTPLLTRS